MIMVVMLKREFCAFPIIVPTLNRCNFCYGRYSGNNKISYQFPPHPLPLSLLYVFLSLTFIKADSSRTSSLENQDAEICLDPVAHSLICSSLN